jgi:hypothetical protein
VNGYWNLSRSRELRSEAPTTTDCQRFSSLRRAALTNPQTENNKKRSPHTSNTPVKYPPTSGKLNSPKKADLKRYSRK